MKECIKNLYTKQVFLLTFLFVIWLLQGCDLVAEKATPVPSGMVKGKVVEWKGSTCYMIDFGSIYKPEPDTVIFVVGVGSNHENRDEWVVEAQCDNTSFIRGIGAKAFPKWPDEIMSETIRLACSAPAPPATLEHPLGKMNKKERVGFIYQPSFAEEIAQKLVAAVTYWAKKRFEESEGLARRE